MDFLSTTFFLKTNLLIKQETNCVLLFKGITKNISSKNDLELELSNICDLTYIYTPSINNKLINKDELSKTTEKKLVKIVDDILTDRLIYDDKDFQKFAKSTLFDSGLIIEKEIGYDINIQTLDNNLNYVINIITDFIENSNFDKGQPLTKLYEILTLPKHKIGLKKGVISLYLSVLLKKYEKNVIILKDNKEQTIDGGLLLEINTNPYIYKLEYTKYDCSIETLSTEIETIFKDYLIENEKRFNSYDYLTSAMFRWYVSLPKYTREAKKKYSTSEANSEDIPKNITEFTRNIKKFNLNSRKFIVNELMLIFETGGNIDLLLSKLLETKNMLECLSNNLKLTLIKELRVLFNINDHTGNLSTNLNIWYENLKETTKNYLFQENENKIFKLFCINNEDDITFINELARIVTGLNIDDWNDNCIIDFIKDINKFKQTIDNYNCETRNSKALTNNVFLLTFNDVNGNKITKTSEKTSISSRAKLLANEISVSIGEMGQSITMQEKRQVLIEILAEIC